jgi:hypothetical protein
MPAYTTDDRQARIVALRPADIRRAADADDPSRARLALHLKDAIRVESQRLSFARAFWVFIAVFAWIILQIVANLPGLRGIPGIRFAAFFGGIVILGIIGRELTRRRVARMVVATAVAEGVCGQCCYSLSSVPTDPDGCVTCPECGAAWSLERITRPHWLAPSLPPTGEEPLRGKARIARALRRFFTATPKPSSLIAPDDRGRFVRTPDSRFFLLSSARRTALTEARLTELRKRVRRKGSILRFLFCIPLAAVGVFAMVGAVACFYDNEPGWGAFVACISLFFLIVAVAYTFGHSFLPPSHTARTPVSDGLCGSCAAPLAALTPGPDGLATCGQCGASWQVVPPQTQP